jgi:rod shape-determining protein MreD
MTLISATQRLDPWRWLGLPGFACVALTILFATPIKVFGLQPPEPVFPIVCAFAWAVIRPSMLAPFALLALGLFLDLWWGGPIGLWPLALLAAYSVTFSVRRVLSGLGWWGMGGWYLVATATLMGAGYLMTAMDTGGAPNPFAVFWQLLASLVLFPFAHRLIERFEDADVRFR